MALRTIGAAGWVALSFLGAAFLLSAGTASVGCAVGSEEEAPEQGAGVPRTQSDASTALDALDPLRPSRPTESPGADASALDEDAEAEADAAASDAGTSAGDAGEGGTSAACAASAPCANATDLGTVQGDLGTDSKVSSGVTSQWFRIRVTEASSSIFGSPLELEVVLDSPPGADFDLYARLDESSDVVDCVHVRGQSNNPAGQADRVLLSWGESSIANGSDDSRTVTLEVRHVSGTCQANQEWNLRARGNP